MVMQPPGGHGGVQPGELGGHGGMQPGVLGTHGGGTHAFGTFSSHRGGGGVVMVVGGDGGGGGWLTISVSHQRL